MNNDCMGGRLVGALKGSNIELIYDSGIKNPKYNHMDKKLKMNNFNSKDNAVQALFLHELFHSQQTDNPSSRLNLEIEAHLATYRYIKRNKLSMMSSPILTAMGELDRYLDAHYNACLLYTSFGNQFAFPI